MNIKLTDEEALNITRQVMWALLMEKEAEIETYEINVELNSINKVLDIIGR